MHSRTQAMHVGRECTREIAAGKAGRHRACIHAVRTCLALHDHAPIYPEPTAHLSLTVSLLLTLTIALTSVALQSLLIHRDGQVVHARPGQAIMHLIERGHLDTADRAIHPRTLVSVFYEGLLRIHDPYG